MKHCIIYKLVCVSNGKLYIGFTRQTLANRWHGHLSESRKGTSNRILSSAIRKYGSKAFIKEILYCSTDIKHTLNVMEKYFIRKYNSHFVDGHGYNMTYGGEGKNSGPRNSSMSLDHRNKIRQARLGKPLSEEHKSKIAAAGQGRKHTPETITKMKNVKRSEEFKTARRTYRVPPEQIKTRVANRTKPTWTIQTPDKSIITTEHIKLTCKENNVAYIALHAAFKAGRAINRGPSKGWQLLSVTPSRNGHAIQ